MEPEALEANDKEHTRSRLVAQVLSTAAAGDFRQVLEIYDRDVQLSAAHINAQYRRLAVLLHPDKCREPRAAEAFTLVGRAREALLRALPQGDSSASSFSAAPGFDSHSSVERWWDTWDCADTFATCSTEPTSQDYINPDLWSLTLAELRQLVIERQSKILSRPPPPTDTSCPQPPPWPSVHVRQRQLRAARSVLAQRLAEEQAAGEEAALRMADEQAARSALAQRLLEEQIAREVEQASAARQQRMAEQAEPAAKGHASPAMDAASTKQDDWMGPGTLSGGAWSAWHGEGAGRKRTRAEAGHEGPGDDA